MSLFLAKSVSKTSLVVSAAARRSLSTAVAASSESSDQASKCIDLEDRYGAHNYHPLPVVLASGKGKCLATEWYLFRRSMQPQVTMLDANNAMQS